MFLAPESPKCADSCARCSAGGKSWRMTGFSEVSVAEPCRALAGDCCKHKISTKPFSARVRALIYLTEVQWRDRDRAAKLWR
jgi:hypothetical protein